MSSVSAEKLKYYCKSVKNVERKTTSIKINPELWKRVKKKCIDDEVDISDYLEVLIKQDLAKR